MTIDLIREVSDELICKIEGENYIMNKAKQVFYHKENPAEKWECSFELLAVDPCLFHVMMLCHNLNLI